MKNNELILDISPHNRPVLSFFAEAQGICAVLGLLIVEKFHLSWFSLQLLNYIISALIGICVLNWMILAFFRHASRDPKNVREFGQINLSFKPLFSKSKFWDPILLISSVLLGIGMRILLTLVNSNSFLQFYSSCSIHGAFTAFIFFIILLFGLMPESMMQIGTANQKISGFFWVFLWRKGLFIIVIVLLSWIIHIPFVTFGLLILFFMLFALIHYICIVLYLQFKPLLSFLIIPAILLSCSLFWI